MFQQSRYKDNNHFTTTIREAKSDLSNHYLLVADQKPVYFSYGAFGTQLIVLIDMVDYGESISVWMDTVSFPRWDTGWHYASAPFAANHKFRVSRSVRLKTGLEIVLLTF